MSKVHYNCTQNVLSYILALSQNSTNPFLPLVDAPVYKVTPNSVEAEAGKSVSVQFSLENEKQCGEISQHTLRKKGSENITTPYKILDNEIMFSEVAVKDGGIYTISGRNEAGEGTASFELNVTSSNGELMLMTVPSMH